MVQAIIDIDEKANRVLNIVKAKFGLNDKSEAIEHIIYSYGMEILEPELKPEYIKKLQKLVKQKGKRFDSVTELRSYIENRNKTRT
jgi:hypothetical protein